MTLRMLTLVAAGSLMVSTAQAETDWNATYGPVPVTSKGIVAAAKFAAAANAVQVKTIVTARQAATAHIHYAICMSVIDHGRTYFVDARISRQTGQDYRLDAWTKVKSCL